MFWSVLLFEIKYRLQRPATYIYFGIFLLFTALVVANGGTTASEKVFHNSPASIGSFFALLGIFSILISSAVMGVPLFRDLEHNTKEYLLATPITKGAYFWGRFWGSLILLIAILTGGIFGYILGTWLGPVFDWTKPERYGPNSMINYLWPFLTILLPSIFFTACTFYGLVALMRNNKVLYTASILLFILYLLANFLVRDLDKRDLVDMLDPFALNTYSNAIKYFTPVEQNTRLVPLEGNLLLNRILWPSLGLVFLLFAYFRFSIQRFISGTSHRVRQKMTAALSPAKAALPVFTPIFSAQLNWTNLWHLGTLEFRNIIKDRYFLSIILGGIIFLFIDDWIGNLTYGVPNRPVTMNMLLFKSYNYSLFVFILIMFYAGETVHRDRATRFATIGDALPVPNWVQLGSKLMAVTGICVLLATIPMLVGITVQTFKGFFEIKFSNYLIDLYGITFWDYFQMALLAFFIHALVNNKFLGHFVGIIIWFMMFVLRNFLEYDYNLFFYSYKPEYLLSDMNGFGHFAAPLFWFNLYWTAFGFILLFLALLLWNRGSEQRLAQRWRAFRQRWGLRPGLALLAIGLIWLGSGGFIYYNVSMVNRHYTSKQMKELSADYEKKFKKYEELPQPKITAVELFADIIPAERTMTLRAVLRMENKTSTPIDSLHLLSENGQKYQISWNGHYLKPVYFDLMPRPRFSAFYPVPDTAGYRIFKLPATLLPGDSAEVVITTFRENPGFVNSGLRREIIHNGTFTSGGIPSIGYSSDMELESDEDRKKYKLPEKPDDLPPHRDPMGEKTLLFNDDADFVSFACTVSTDPDQIAVAPGYLQKEWTENGRRYFHYVLDKKTDYFFNIVSARYTIARDTFLTPDGKPINLEIYYHKDHDYNLDRMMAGMKDGLAYFNTHFGPYQFRQLRILEFPRYAVFAQSFPNTVPYSEDFGWYADFSDPNDYDYFYYVTVHELAHQWWGHQAVPNRTRGANLISESLAEYSALMVAQKRYGRDNLQRFLKYDMDRYLRGRANESKKENVFINCNRSYQWYQKGSLILYALQDYIGEEKLNGAIRGFLDSFGLKEQPPFPGSYDLYGFIQQVVPDSLQYFLEDSWLKIILYENRILEASAKSLGKDNWEVTLQVRARKLVADEKGNESEAKDMNDYIDIGIFAEELVAADGKKTVKPIYLKKHRLTNGDHTLTFQVKGKPIKAGIDPYNKLIDRIPDDNIIVVELNK